MDKRSFIFLAFLFLGLKHVPLCAKIKKDWTFIVYIAADNDLNFFARKNINDMKKIGSSDFINILVQLDGYGIHEKTKRFFIEKGAAIQTNINDITSYQKLNSGSAQTLIDCCKWAIENYPANHYALLLWNHGTGILDNIRSKTVNASEIFTFNPSTHMLELDRSIEFLQFVKEKEKQETNRGVCFSDTYGSYLTNEKLYYALATIKNSLLQGKNLDIVAFDACLMSMTEVGNLLSEFVDIMVGSQEVELGTGWSYNLVLEPFIHSTLTADAFAKHMVESYKTAYENVTNDYTQSAICLKKIKSLENNINQLSTALIEAIQTQKNFSVSRSIKASRSRRLCTHFSEPSYIDLHHFYLNLLQTVEFMSMYSNEPQQKESLTRIIKDGLELIPQTVLANAAGAALPNAKGLSIYFPTRYIEVSYTRTPFAKGNKWLDLLNLAL